MNATSFPGRVLRAARRCAAVPLWLACSLGACSGGDEADRSRGLSNGTGGAGFSGGSVGSGGALLAGSQATSTLSGGTCGDGSLERQEQCDDGNKVSGDGCSRLCQVEANWSCPTPGKPCEYLGVCGNGLLTSNKACDDGNTVDGDGCSADCQTVETGYICRMPGKPCTTLCGDARIMGSEECDDGNSESGDGCSSICRVEAGWTCTSTAPSSCTRSVCGNGQVEAGESCDDGNTLPFDGCSPTCQSDPKCGTATSAIGTCKTVCGDGILLRGTEECDDGNVRDGDGCSHDCTIEPGNTCRSAYDDPPTKLEIPIIVRDFQGYYAGSPPTGHPDFGHYCCDAQKGITQATLDIDRKPVYAGTDASPIHMTTGKTAFDQWYRDVSGTNQTFYQSLTLLQNSTTKTTYSMNSDTDDPWYDRCGFFPLDSTPVLDTNTGKAQTYTDSAFPGRTCTAYEGLGFGRQYLNHNYGFTSELRYWFQYQGNENLKFTGDDDVWVFINGQLAVDLGGVHDRAAATVILDATKGTAQVGYGDPPSSYSTVDLHLTIAGVYEVVLLQAERWCCGSNYMLSLANFLAGRSECGPTCGDGVRAGTEECDSGADNSDTAYGGCTTECKWGPFCGDGIVQGESDGGPEECDQGRDNGNTSTSGEACSLTCKKTHFCGDEIVDTDLGEDCDLGAKNGVRLDDQLRPASDGAGQILCTTDCEIPPEIVY